MPNRIAHLTTVRPIVDSQAVMTQEGRSWAQSITNLIMINGTGSPEGVIEAIVGAQYTDTNGTTGTMLYIKRDADVGGDKSQGWILS